MVANASAYAPNVQKGLQAAANIISILERKPKIQDSLYISKTDEVSYNILYGTIFCKRD